MKYAFMAIVLAASALASCNRGTSDDYLRYGISFPAKSVTNIPDTSLYVTPADYTTLNFNTEGRITSRMYYHPGGEPMNYEIYEYDDRGHLSSYSFYDLDGTYEGGYTYEYDGKLIKTCKAHSPEHEETSRWENENDGRHITRSLFYSEDILVYESMNKWDKKGRVRDETTYDGDGEFVGQAHYVYAAEDMPSLIESEQMRISIEYNDKVLPIFSDGAAINSSGELEWIDSEENPVSYEYEYDAHGNWVLRCEYRGSDSVLYRAVRRQIEY